MRTIGNIRTCLTWAGALLALAVPGAASASDDPELSAPGTQVPEPGEQVPPRIADQATASPPASRQRRSADWRLSIDMSVIADSNVTNSTDAETVDLDLGGTILPVPLDPNLREHGDVGTSVAAALSGRVPVAGGVAVAVNAEGYALEYGGSRTDDASLLVAGGIEIGASPGPTATIQATGFVRDYGGVSAMRGIGLRGRFAQPLGGHRRVTLLIDARIFESGYGEDFEGTEAGLYLGYETPISAAASASFGLFGRGSWLGNDAYSNLEFGAYGGLSTYIGSWLVGGATAGISRVEFEDAIPMLGADPRSDWRWYGSLYLTTRRPVLAGVTPSITYTYGQTDSSILFYRANRQRLRVGLSRSF